MPLAVSPVMFVLTDFVAQAVPRFPSSSALVLFALLLVGALAWLFAAILGFARARVFGAPVRWFALASVCMLIYHLQFIALAYLGSIETDLDKVLRFGAFFNLFVALAAVCAVIGFARLSNPRL